MKKIIQTVADGGGELGVHMYPSSVIVITRYESKARDPHYENTWSRVINTSTHDCASSRHVIK